MRLFESSENKESADWAKDFFSRLSLAQMERHRVLGFALSQGFLNDSDSAQPVVTEQARRSAQKEALMRKLLADVQKLALESSIPVGVLKGAALILQNYYRPIERDLADLDIYVDPAFHTRLLDLFEKAGFELRTESSALSGFKTICLHPSTGDFGIEVHTKLWWREPSQFQWTWVKSEPGISVLSKEDQLIHLAGHWVAQHTMLSLHWLLDIALFLRATSAEMNWELVEARARELHLAKSVAISLHLVRVLFGQSQIPELNISYPEVNFEFLLDPKKNSLKYFWLKHRVQDRLLHSLAYDYHWLFSHERGHG